MKNFSNEEIRNCFIKSLNSEEPNIWICKLCSNNNKKIKQRLSSGYTNLKSHLNNAHPNWQSSFPTQGKLSSFIKPKASNIYGWLRKIVLNCQPINIVENEIELEYSTLKPICRKSIKNAITNTAAEVRNIIANILPEKFALCFDAWTENRIHFLAVYASFNDGANAPQNILLCFTNLIDESNWNATNYAETIMNVLSTFNRSLGNVVCLIGDNCNTNKKLATILKLPLIGCASHKLNLAVENYLKNFSEIEVVNKLMIKLSTPIKSAKLKKLIHLRPITRNVTRWSSCFEMIERFFEILEFIDISDLDLAGLMPSHIQILQLHEIRKELKLLNELTIYLQLNSINLSDVRKCFDRLCLKHPQMEKYLGVNSNIIHSPKFDSGVIKVLDNKENELDQEEKLNLNKLYNMELNYNEELKPTENPYIFSRPLQCNLSKYINLNFILPTSNIVERLFSLSKRIYCDQRKSLDVSTLEDIIFLNQNKKLWNEEIVEKVIH